MKRRDVYLFLSFVAMFILFAVFQNFSFPTKQLQQLTNKEFFQQKLRGFVPTYAFKDYIGGAIEVPYGYKDEIKRKIASKDDPIIFDQKSFLKDGLKETPIYKDIKDLLDVSRAPTSDEAPPCVKDPAAQHNNCFTEYSGDARSSGSVKIKANPLRQTASVSVPGDVESLMVYDNERKSVNVQFKKELNNDSGIKLELDSEEQSGSINIDVRW